jgi:hypothetical protein
MVWFIFIILAIGDFANTGNQDEQTRVLNRILDELQTLNRKHK